MYNKFNSVKQRFLNAGIVEQLIYVNVGVYIITFLTEIFRNRFMLETFSLIANYTDFIYKPWTILTYGFLHNGFIHILGNLIALFYFGNLFLEYFTKKQLLQFYIFGTLIGGLFFLLGGFFIPRLNNGTLIGASAGVSAILIGITTYIPKYQLHFRLLGYIRLWHIAVVWLGYNLLLISASQNIGGNLAHLGGALFAFLYVPVISNKKLHLFEPVKQLFSKKKPKLKTVYKSNVKKKVQSEKSDKQKEIDVILDKIGKSGYDSLSKKEKDFLFQQGQ